jgi:hypothetical protein
MCGGRLYFGSPAHLMQFITQAVESRSAALPYPSTQGNLYIQARRANESDFRNNDGFAHGWMRE